MTQGLDQGHGSDPSRRSNEGHGFDKAYWDAHWQQAHSPTTAREDVAPNPYLAHEAGDLVPGAALDAGCGEGAEAIWLASAGWRVTAADIAAGALARAAERAERQGVSGHVRWVEADLTSWEPGETFDLVTTHYAHPAMPQPAFYARLAAWVAPGGTLLVVGHRDTGDPTDTADATGHGHSLGHGHDQAHGHGHRPPAEASVTAEDITAVLDPSRWEVVTAEEPDRTLTGPEGRSGSLQDVVVRAIRRA